MDNNSNTFDDYNSDYHVGQDQTSSVVADLVGGTVASVADFAGSVWNSLPGTDYVDTADLLARVDNNALRVYEEHPDAIHAASFIGGMFVPTGLALKGMTAMRAGAKGATWFSNAGKAESLATIDKLFVEGAAATTEYRAAKNAFYAKGLANQVLDAAAMEFALIGTMNAHPFMEDYMKDPVSNFASSLVLGGVIGGGIGHIADRFQIGKLEKTAEGGIFTRHAKDLVETTTAQQMADQVATEGLNIGTLKNIIQKETAAGLAADSLSMQTANRYLLTAEAAQKDAFDAMLDPRILAAIKANPAIADPLMVLATSNEFRGVNKVEYLTQNLDASGNITKIKAGARDTLVPAPVFKSATTNLTDKVTGEVIAKESLVDVAYSQEFGVYYPLEMANQLTRARDLGISVKDMAKDVGRMDLPRADASLELLSKNTAAIDAHNIGLLKRIDEMTIAEVKAIPLATDDMATRSAILARVAKEKESGVFDGHKWKVTDNKPSLEAFSQQIIVSQAKAGVKATHLADNLKFTKPGPEGLNKYDLLINDIPSESARAKSAIEDWVSGHKGPLTSLMEDMRLDKGTILARDGEAIYNSTYSKALRAEFLKNADNEGYVYLYRGITKGKNVGHGALESYTTDASKAAEFTTGGRIGEAGSVKLYKVNVDDIIGAVGDIPKQGTHTPLNEIIVRAGTRETHASPATLPIASGSEAKTIINKTGVGIEEHDASTLSQQLIDLKDSNISALLRQGVPFETIAIRTGTPLETVKAFSLLPEGSSVTDVLNAVGHVEYNSAARIDEYLDPGKRTLRLKSDINKQSVAKVKANLDSSNLDTINAEVTSSFMAGSGSSIARQLGAYLHSKEMAPKLAMLRAKIGEFGNAGSGNKFLGSSDFAFRNMGDVGMLVTAIGKKLTHDTNEAKNLILKPISEHYATIVTDDVARVEYNTAINVNAGITGWREFKDGQFWTKVASIDPATQKAITTLEPVLYQGKEFKVISKSVKDVFAEHQVAGRELYEMKNTANKIQGIPNMSDIGLWIPSASPVNKFRAYVHNALDDTTKLLYANTPEELLTIKKAYEATIPAGKLANGDIKVYLPKDQEMWNKLNNRYDPLATEIANVSMQHGGSSANAVVRADANVMGDIAAGYEHYIVANMRNLAELSMHDVISGLARISSYNKRVTDNQVLNPIVKFLHTPKDTANVIKNTLLGNSNLQAYGAWKDINQSFETGLSAATSKVGEIWKEAVKPFMPNILGKKSSLEAADMAKMDYEALSKKMESVGAVNPWANFDEAAAKMFGLSKLTDSRDTSKRIIYASNSLAATMALRFGELAQPLVNAMSLPILTSLAVSHKMPETFMGIKKATTKVGTVQVMHDGIRAMHDPAFTALRAEWASSGALNAMVSEANDTLKLARSFDKGLIPSVEKALDSKIVKIMSKAADWSETTTRSVTMHTGAALAKRLYPELDNAGITIFARDFADRAMGNMSASQRPVLFQGTLGVALGLFQTYTLTLGQSVYRHLELKDYKALGKAALAQSTIFGTASMPGFNAVSEMIGTHYSDNNMDLTTGTYRALPDATADAVLYGLPSSLGPAFYTRGEIAPRVPTAPGEIVAVNMAKQMAGMVGHVADAIASERPDVARSVMEAFSMQSMSRPLARGAELATGYSVTSKGNTVSIPEEVWTPIGIMARVIGTRPLEEAKLRQAMHLNTFYGADDHKNRQELQMKLKTAIRGDTLTPELLAKIGEEYMRKGGSVQGWNSAKNTVLGTTNMSGRQNLANLLKPDSPLNFMIDNL